MGKFRSGKCVYPGIVSEMGENLFDFWGSLIERSLGCIMLLNFISYKYDKPDGLKDTLSETNWKMKRKLVSKY